MKILETLHDEYGIVATVAEKNGVVIYISGEKTISFSKTAHEAKGEDQIVGLVAEALGKWD